MFFVYCNKYMEHGTARQADVKNDGILDWYCYKYCMACESTCMKRKLRKRIKPLLCVIIRF